MRFATGEYFPLGHFQKKKWHHIQPIVAAFKRIRSRTVKLHKAKCKADKTVSPQGGKRGSCCMHACSACFVYFSVCVHHFVCVSACLHGPLLCMPARYQPNTHSLLMLFTNFILLHSSFFLMKTPAMCIPKSTLYKLTASPFSVRESSAASFICNIPNHRVRFK